MQSIEKICKHTLIVLKQEIGLSGNQGTMRETENAKRGGLLRYYMSASISTDRPKIGLCAVGQDRSANEKTLPSRHPGREEVKASRNILIYKTHFTLYRAGNFNLRNCTKNSIFCVMKIIVHLCNS